MSLLNQEVEEFREESTEEAGSKLVAYIKEKEMVGDLLSLDYSEATILVHDALRQEVGGLPMGCFLLSTRIEPNTKPEADKEDTALILLRVVGHTPLPNRTDTDTWRFDAARRSIDSPEHWDADNKTDQFTLNQLRHAGVRCNVLGTFRFVHYDDGHWRLTFGADISNFYSGQGMKIYKPMGETLSKIVNFTKPMGGSHPLAGKPVPVGRVRYSSSEIEFNENRENVTVLIEPTDMLARRTALFGMSRSGKSNTIKTVASAIFKLREIFGKKERVGQLIFDVNGEYANDNPQDKGCLRNIGRDVVTYGLFEHPNDVGRRLIKLNFFGEYIRDWNDKDGVRSSLSTLFAGKEIINEHLRGSTNVPQYVSRFINTNTEPPPSAWDMSAQTRYRRNITVYWAILAAANFRAPSNLQNADINNLFGKDLRNALKSAGDAKYTSAADTLGKGTTSWSELHQALTALQEFVIGGKNGAGHSKFQEFNNRYQARTNGSGEPWNDDTLNGLLYLLSWSGGVGRIRELQERHSPDVQYDYSTKIVDELIDGKLVIVDQSIGSPDEIKHTSERVMWELFSRQRHVFTNPPSDEGRLVLDKNGNILPPPDVIVYVEEAHNLIPSHDPKLDSIWARIAKEGSKFHIGLVYSTQEPSSILANILKNTDNWFVAHLNNKDETSELKKYYDFDMFVDQILKVPDTGFLRMRCLSNPYIVPVQINKFTAEPQSDGEDTQKERTNRNAL